MSEPPRRRADATRNRTKVLDAAFQVFSEQGTAAPIDDIARRAGVGPGTLYRHFPTKEDLFRAVVADRFQAMVDHGRAVRSMQAPGEAFFNYMRTLILGGGDNRALVDAIMGSQFDVLEAEAPFLSVLGDLLHDAQEAGTVRGDVGVMQVKALLAACYAVRSTGEDLVESVMTVVLDGLRKRPDQ